MLIERARERQKISARGDDEVAQKTFVMKRSQGGNSSELPGYLHYLLGNQIDITHTHTHTRAREVCMDIAASQLSISICLLAQALSKEGF